MKGSIATCAPPVPDSRPAEVSLHHVAEEGGQLTPRHGAPVLAQLFGVELHIRQLHIHLVHIPLLRQDEGVDLGLRPVLGVVR